MKSAVLTADPEISFSEPIQLILREKGHGVWFIAPEATVYEAIQMMSDKHIGALVVVSGDRLVGIVSERDYARKVILQGKQSQTTPVREIMTTPVLYVTPEHTVDQCLRLMTSRHVRHLPVLDGEFIAGVISIGDLVEWTIRGHKHMIHQLENYIAGAYPA